MDLLERLNRRFGSWYEGLFGGAGTDDVELRPKDILRRILAGMEDGRREGLDGQVYVPNAYTLRIAVSSDAERDYLRAFLNAEELATAVARTIAQHGYKTRGGLLFVIEEADATDPNTERVAVTCRFDATVTPASPPPAPVEEKKGKGKTASNAVTTSLQAATPSPFSIEEQEEVEDEELGTVPAAFAPGGGGPALATLLVRSGNGRSLEAFPLTMRGATIGRSRQSGNDIVLTEPQISKRHGRIVFERGGFVYYDEQSTNGSLLNDTTVAPGVPYTLQFGDVIRLGETTLTLRPIGGGTPPPTPAPVSKPTATSAKSPALIASNGTMYRIASEMVIGRSVTADITLSGPNISERHARLKTTDLGKLTVEDLNTPGGTFVNGERIPPLFPVTLYDGDEMVIGQGTSLQVRMR